MNKMKKSNMRRITTVGLTLLAFTFSCTNLDEELFSDVTADNRSGLRLFGRLGKPHEHVVNE